MKDVFVEIPSMSFVGNGLFVVYYLLQWADGIETTKNDDDAKAHTHKYIATNTYTTCCLLLWSLGSNYTTPTGFIAQKLCSQCAVRVDRWSTILGAHLMNQHNERESFESCTPERILEMNNFASVCLPRVTVTIAHTRCAALNSVNKSKHRHCFSVEFDSSNRIAEFARTGQIELFVYSTSTEKHNIESTMSRTFLKAILWMQSTTITGASSAVHRKIINATFDYRRQFAGGGFGWSMGIYWNDPVFLSRSSTVRSFTHLLNANWGMIDDWLPIFPRISRPEMLNAWNSIRLLPTRISILMAIEMNCLSIGDATRDRTLAEKTLRIGIIASLAIKTDDDEAATEETLRGI